MLVESFAPIYDTDMWGQRSTENVIFLTLQTDIKLLSFFNYRIHSNKRRPKFFFFFFFLSNMVAISCSQWVLIMHFM